MGVQMRPADGAMSLAEMKEFAGFPAATQRYVRRSLDIGLSRQDAMSCSHWPHSSKIRASSA